MYRQSKAFLQNDLKAISDRPFSRLRCRPAERHLERRQVGKAVLAVQDRKSRRHRSRRSNSNTETELHRAPEIGKRVAGIADCPIYASMFERNDGSCPKEARRIERSQLKRFVLSSG